MKSRKLKYVELSAHGLVALLKGGNIFSIINGLPQDSIAVALEHKAWPYDAKEYAVMVLVVHSTSFEEVPEGEIIPQLTIGMQLLGRRTD